MRRNKAAYNNFVCPFCFRKLNNCICENFPPWNLIFIDEGMQECIIKLNDKGYRTSGCCESHYKGNPNLYISFFEMYDFAVKPPAGNKARKHRCDIVYPIPQKNKEEFERLKAEKIKEILNWIESLPGVNGR